MRCTITCQTMKQFLDVIAGLVERGITFEACAEYKTVITLGGF